jgi:hypothetical protein
MPIVGRNHRFVDELGLAISDSSSDSEVANPQYVGLRRCTAVPAQLAEYGIDRNVINFLVVGRRSLDRGRVRDTPPRPFGLLGDRG